MTPGRMEDFLILRELNKPVSRDSLDAAAEASGETLEELRSERTDSRWVNSEVLTDDGGIVDIFCHYQATNKAVVRKHGDRAGLPVTRVAQRGNLLKDE